MRFCKIKSIVAVDTKPIIHLTVEKNHNFFGNNLCLHNCGYRGEIGVILINHGNKDFEIKAGDKIAQMVICKFESVDIKEVLETSETSRSANGFGSSDKK